MAWLDWRPDDPRDDDREHHFAARLDYDGALAYPKRKAGRDSAKADARYARMLSWERPENGDEPIVMAT